MIGKQEQIPPKYSAIKVNGKKLYEYARKGQEVEIKPRKIEIYKIELIKINKKDKKIEFNVSCSKGTYIRSLCEDIAEKLGTIGYMSNLIRLQVGEFSIENSITIENIEKSNNPEEAIMKNLITIEQQFHYCENIILNQKQLEQFLNGMKIKQDKKEGIYKIYNENTFIGLGEIKEGKLKRDIII